MKRTGESLVAGGSKHAMVECPKCKKAMRADNMKRHILQHNEMLTCKYCKKSIRSDQLLKHKLLCESKVDETLINRKTGVSQLDRCDHQSSLNGFFRSIELPVKTSNDYDNILDEACLLSKDLLVDYVRRHPVKAQIILKLSFYKERMASETKCLKSSDPFASQSS